MTKYKFVSPRYPGFPAHTTDMRLLLAEAHKNPAINGSRWPATGLPEVVVQGVVVWVTAAPKPTGKKSSTHRVMCACPGCGLELSAGRLFQHVCKKVAV